MNDVVTRTSSDAFIALLRNLGGRREIEQYLRAFTDRPSDRFIVVKIGGGVIDRQLEECAAALSMLWHIGLRPIVIHGAGGQLSEAFDEAGIECKWVDGLRVTPVEAIPIIRRVCRSVASALTRAHESRGIRCRPLPSDVIHAEPYDDRLGLVGEVTEIDVHQITDAIEAGCIPVISSLGVSGAGQLLNINADSIAAGLARTLQPRKIVFLTPTGGLLDQYGRIIPAIDLADGLSSLIAEPWVTDGMQRKLIEIATLLEQLEPGASISITSPTHLLRELFTHAGDGTLIRVGTPVRILTSTDSVDWPRLRTLLETSFNSRVDPAYPGDLPIRRVFVGGEYDAGAVVANLGPAAYLDKFAVTAQAQGVGLGASVWKRLIEVEDRLFWRSRPYNKINGWYFERADGFVRLPEWCVFWRGLTDRREIESCVRAALAVKPTIFSRATEPLEVPVNVP